MAGASKTVTSVKDKLLATHLMASMVAMAVILFFEIVPHARMFGVIGYVILVLVSPALLPVMWLGSLLDVLELPASDPTVHAWLGCALIYLASFSAILHKLSKKR